MSSLQACELLLKDHRRNEELLAELGRHLAEIDAKTPMSPGLRSRIKATLDEIHSDLNTHFACEEQVLFPALERVQHPMVLMEVEHEELMNLLHQLEKLFPATEGDSRSNPEFVKTAEKLTKELLEHIAREDGGIFPMAERDLADEDKQAVIDGMQAIRKKAEREPIPEISRKEPQFRVVRLDTDTMPERGLVVEKLFEDGNRQLKHMVLRAGEALKAHWAPRPVLLFAVTGRCVWEGSGRNVTLEPGQGVMMDARLNHALRAESDTHLLLVYFD